MLNFNKLHDLFMISPDRLIEQMMVDIWEEYTRANPTAIPQNTTVGQVLCWARTLHCKWCKEGNPRTRSSVTERFIHTDTPIGRVMCNRPQEQTPQQPHNCSNCGKTYGADTHRCS